MADKQLHLDGSRIELSATVQKDKITEEIESKFDFKSESGKVSETIFVPIIPSEYQIGLIVGSSGSGKSTLLKNVFHSVGKAVEWDNTKSIASHFESAEDASSKFGAVGLNSLPTWLKPYNVLSTGEKFRADMARLLKDDAVIDEFTSVVNREVAMSCSMSISKYIRNNELQRVTFASCHDDIIPYLSPDWIYNTDTHEFYNGRYLCRPQIHLKVFGCSSKAWDIFKRYHYLSGEINKSSACYMATYNEIPVAFLAVLSFPNGNIKHGWREHRLVVLPDYQGMGIGNKFSETIAQAYVDRGCRYFCKTSNPRMGEHRDRSSLWRATSHNKTARTDYFRNDGTVRIMAKTSARMTQIHANRVCYSHEYIGDGKTYPYTLMDDDQIDGQMSILDFV